jgi:hypothetical protein
VHYGIVPGCEPKFDRDGDLVVWMKGKGQDAGKMVKIGADQWRSRPSLYKAGAEFICKLYRYRATFHHDKLSWEMLGKPASVFFKCKLFNPAGNEVGQGVGSRGIGQKGGDTNNVIKMAKKCAQVDAVLTTFGLSDLFTQDREDAPPAHAAPEADQNAPHQAPRSERLAPVPQKDVEIIRAVWKTNNEGATWDTWRDFVHKHAKTSFDVRNADLWSPDIYKAVQDAVNYEVQGDATH